MGIKEKFKYFFNRNSHHPDFEQPSKAKKITAAVVVGLFGVLLLFLVVSSAGITGYTIEKSSTIDSYESQINSLNTKIESTEENLTNLQISLDDIQTEITGKDDKISSLESSNSNLQDQIDDKNSRISDLENQVGDRQKELDDFKDGNNALIKNVAKRFCCLEQVIKGNQNLDYYEVNGDDIECKESGDDKRKIECF